MAEVTEGALFQFRTMAATAMTLLSGVCPKFGFLEIPILLDSAFKVDRKMNADGTRLYMELTNESRRFGISADRSFSRDGKDSHDHYFFNQSIGDVHPIVLKMGATLKNGMLHSFKDVPALRFECNKPEISVSLYFDEGQPVSDAEMDDSLSREMQNLSFEGKARSDDFGDSGKKKDEESGSDSDDDDDGAGSDMEDFTPIASVESQNLDDLPEPNAMNNVSFDNEMGGGGGDVMLTGRPGDADEMELDDAVPLLDTEVPEIAPKVVTSKTIKRKRDAIDAFLERRNDDDSENGIEDDDEDGDDDDDVIAEPAAKRSKTFIFNGGVKMSNIDMPVSTPSSSSSSSSSSRVTSPIVNYPSSSNAIYMDDQEVEEQEQDYYGTGTQATPVIAHSLYRSNKAISMRLVKATSVDALAKTIAEFVKGVDLTAVGVATFTINLERGDRPSNKIVNANLYASSSKLLEKRDAADSVTLRWDTREGAVAAADFGIMTIQNRTQTYDYAGSKDVDGMKARAQEWVSKLTWSLAQGLSATSFFDRVFPDEPENQEEQRANYKDFIEIWDNQVSFMSFPRMETHFKSARQDPRTLPIPGDKLDMQYTPDMGYHIVANADIGPGKDILTEEAVVHTTGEEFRKNACDYCGIIWGEEARKYPKKGSKSRPGNGGPEEPAAGGDGDNSASTPLAYDPDTGIYTHNASAMLPDDSNHVQCKCKRVIFCTGCMAKGMIYHQFECEMFRAGRLEECVTSHMKLFPVDVRTSRRMARGVIETFVRTVRMLIRFATVHILDLSTARVLQTLQQSLPLYRHFGPPVDGTLYITHYTAGKVYQMFEGIDLGGKPAVLDVELLRWQAQITENAFGSPSRKPVDSTFTSFHQQGSMIHGVSAFFNHSCNPTALWRYVYKQGQMPKIVITTRGGNARIKEGDVITISYNSEPNVLNRRMSLLTWYRFECWCTRCNKEMNKVAGMVRGNTVEKTQKKIKKAKKLLSVAREMPNNDDDDDGGNDDDNNEDAGDDDDNNGTPRITKKRLVKAALAEKKMAEEAIVDLDRLDAIEMATDEKVESLQNPRTLDAVFAQQPLYTAKIDNPVVSQYTAVIETYLNNVLSALDGITYEDYRDKTETARNLSGALRKARDNLEPLWKRSDARDDFKSLVAGKDRKYFEERIAIIRDAATRGLEYANDNTVYKL